MKRNYLVGMALSILLFMCTTETASAIRIKFKGSGGVNVVDGEIVSICPIKGHSICAVIVCPGLLGIVRCLYLKWEFGTIEPVSIDGPNTKGRPLNEVIPGYLKTFDHNKNGNMKIGLIPSQGKLIVM